MEKDKPLKKFEDLTIGDLQKIHNSFKKLMIVRNNFNICKETMEGNIETMDEVLKEVSKTLEEQKNNMKFGGIGL